MAKAPKHRDIREDLPEGEWRRLVTEFVREVGAALSRGLTVDENMRAHVRELDVTGDDTEIAFTVPFQSPIGVLVLEARNLDDYETPGSMTGLAWRTSDGKVLVYNFAGLAEGVRYRVRFLVLGGG